MRNCKKKTNQVYLCPMRLAILFFTLLIFSSCEQGKPAAFDYVQYQSFDMTPYDLSVELMLPNASSGIGTSMKPQVAYEIGGFKWTLQVGRNFSLFIEDYGDYAFRFAEFKRKLLKPNPFFEIEIVKQTADLPQKSERRICCAKKCAILYLQCASDQWKLFRNHEPWTRRHQKGYRFYVPHHSIH